MSPKVSIIVPIYNVAPFIERCVRSLMEQTFSECEYIFIDDASPDESVDILRKTLSEYQERIPFVKIIHNPANKGLAETRFVGMDEARGEYVLHCDSDDWVEPDMVEIMYTTANNHQADIVMCEVIKESVSQSEYLAIDYDEEFLETGLLALRLQEQYVAVWNKLIKRSLFITHAIRNYPGINMSEDSALTIRLRYFSKKSVVVHKGLYHYNRQNAGSMCADFTSAYTEQLIKLAKHLEVFFAHERKQEEFKHVVNYYKFIAKRPVLCIEHNYDKWKTIFPESHDSILSFHNMKRWSRLKWWIYSHLPSLFARTWSNQRIFKYR